MEFSNGVKEMARNVIPAIQLVHKGIWTLGDMEDWLNAVINETEENPELRSKAWLQLMQNTRFPTY